MYNVLNNHSIYKKTNIKLSDKKTVKKNSVQSIVRLKKHIKKPREEIL